MRFGRKGDLIYHRGNSIEVDIGDFRSDNRAFEVLGCDGALHLHFGGNKIRDSIRGAFPNAGVFGENQEREFAKKTDAVGEN